MTYEYFYDAITSNQRDVAERTGGNLFDSTGNRARPEETYPLSPMYLLLDTNVTAAYYLPRSTNSQRVRNRIENIFNSVRSGASDHFFYLPNFCVAEVFSVFMKHAFGSWNRHVSSKGTIDKRVYESLCNQFEIDIHNARFIYHYELSRYHVLGINLVAPVDHYFRIFRGKHQTVPMGTFDHLIISMGIHLAHIHGHQNVAVISADHRLTKILAKCKSRIPIMTIQKLKLDRATEITGRSFKPDIFPQHVNLATANNTDLTNLFGKWPLPEGRVPRVYRWLKI
jgi:hypothetical protein